MPTRRASATRRAIRVSWKRACTLVDGRLAPAEATASRTPEAASHGRRRHPHACRSGRAAGALRRMPRTCSRDASSSPLVSSGAATTCAVVLHRQTQFGEALAELDRLWKSSRAIRAIASCTPPCSVASESSRAIHRAVSKVLAEYPAQPKVWMSYGHALKTSPAGRGDSVAAYRKQHRAHPAARRSVVESRKPQARGASPTDDMQAMRTPARATRVCTDERPPALSLRGGQGARRRRAVRRILRALRAGNAIRRAQVRYDAEESTATCGARVPCSHRELFAARAGCRLPARPTPSSLWACRARARR